MEVRDMVRDMNCATSQRVFIGPYLDDPKVAKKFSDSFMDMVGGFLTFPLKFPGTAVWRAMKVGANFARSRQHSIATNATPQMLERGFWADLHATAV
jgi:hypothetical protein